jgi:3-hydroxybutyryl-CoA dehydrogenase
MTVKKSISKKQTSRTIPAPPAKKKSAAEPRLTVCLLGDDQLTKEYSALFQRHGIAVIETKNLTSLKTSAKKISIAFELTLPFSEEKKRNLIALDASLPPEIPVVTNAVAETVLAQSQHVSHPSRLIGIAAFPTLLENTLVELSPSLYTSQHTAEAVTAFFSALKKERAIVEDAVGMVMPRILCQIINEALFTVQNDVANPKDIDTAMKLGTNYPYGPIEWGESIGFKNIVAVLDSLYHHHHEERYRVAPLLRQLSIAGTFWREANKDIL